MTTALRHSELSRDHRHPMAPVTAGFARPGQLGRSLQTSSAPTSCLDGIGSVALHARGRTVVKEGDAADYVYKVVAGSLRSVRLLPDGRRHITSFLLAGDFFGLAAGAEHAQSVEVVADATLIRYPRRAVNGLLESDARLGRHLFGLVCGELSAAQDRLLLLGRKSAVERLASFLLAMADRSRDGDEEIDLPMSRQDVADYLGLTIETVSRLFTQLKNQRVIGLPSTSKVALLDRDALEDIAGGEPTAAH